MELILIDTLSKGAGHSFIVDFPSVDLNTNVGSILPLDLIVRKCPLTEKKLTTLVYSNHCKEKVLAHE